MVSDHFYPIQAGLGTGLTATDGTGVEIDTETNTHVQVAAGNVVTSNPDLQKLCEAQSHIANKVFRVQTTPDSLGLLMSPPYGAEEGFIPRTRWQLDLVKENAKRAVLARITPGTTAAHVTFPNPGIASIVFDKVQLIVDKLTVTKDYYKKFETVSKNKSVPLFQHALTKSITRPLGDGGTDLTLENLGNDPFVFGYFYFKERNRNADSAVLSQPFRWNYAFPNLGLTKSTVKRGATPDLITCDCGEDWAIDWWKGNVKEIFGEDTRLKHYPYLNPSAIATTTAFFPFSDRFFPIKHDPEGSGSQLSIQLEFKEPVPEDYDITVCLFNVVRWELQYDGLVTKRDLTTPNGKYISPYLTAEHLTLAIGSHMHDAAQAAVATDV